jgi:hypothetical protein
MHGHLDALGWLHVLAGWIGLLTGASLLLLAAGAASLPVEASDAGGVQAVFWLLLVVGLLLMIGGGLMIATGRGLVARRPRARLGALLLALPGLCALPFGTALSFYTVWALLNDDARGAFGRRLRGTGEAGSRSAPPGRDG